jgi:hypothetical protein
LSVPAAAWQRFTDALRVWKPGIRHGLLQTRDYARALIAAVGARMRELRLSTADLARSAWMSGYAKREPRVWPEYGAVVDLLARLTVLGSLNMDISVTVPTLPGSDHPRRRGGLRPRREGR